MNDNTQSAKILDYCLGLLSETDSTEFEKQMQSDAVLNEKVQATMKTMHSHMADSSAKPSEHLKGKTWSLLQNVTLEKRMDPNELPLLNKYSDTEAWNSAVTALLPRKLDKSRPFMRVLTNTDKVMQMLIATSFDFPDEVHEDVLESFIILQGECECRIGSETIRVRAGGYLEIPLYTNHDVKIVSDGIVGVLQRINLTQRPEVMNCK